MTPKLISSSRLWYSWYFYQVWCNFDLLFKSYYRTCIATFCNGINHLTPKGVEKWFSLVNLAWLIWIHLNVHLSCFVDFVLCPIDKYMFKVNHKKIRLTCWMCSRLKINRAWHSSGVFIVNFDHNQHINIVFLFLTLNKYLLGCERQVIMFWKHKKRHIFFVKKLQSLFYSVIYHCIELK